MSEQVKYRHNIPGPLFLKATKIMAEWAAEANGVPDAAWTRKALAIAMHHEDKQLRQIMELAVIGTVVTSLLAVEGLTDDQRATISMLLASPNLAGAALALSVELPELVNPKLGFGEIEFVESATPPTRSDKDLLRHWHPKIRAMAEEHYGVTPEPPKPVDTAPLANLKPAEE